MDILDKILQDSKSLNETRNFDLKNFKKQYINKRQPIVLKGYANKWSALGKWNFDFLSNLEIKDTVRLEIGNVIQNDINVKRMDFKSYINALRENQEDGKKNKAYLSMFNLFGYFPELLEDVDLSILTNYTKYNTPGAWIGPAGTVTGFHWDSSDNILSQVMGRKLILLVSPKFKKAMYPSDKYDYDSHASQVDINAYDEVKFPRFKQVEIKKVILEPGDTLFVPRGWWHYVKSLDTSVSVSNFGSYRHGYTYYKEFIGYRLHMRGYYKTADCTCHKMVDGKRVTIGRM